MKIFITGAAGFIGFHICQELMNENNELIGLDNINEYYSKSLKEDRLRILQKKSELNSYKWDFFKGDLLNKDLLNDIFFKFKPDIVIHLAAQAGVRYSLENPDSYISSNLVGFFNVIECCRNFKTNNFIYASSSSVYGGNSKIPFSETDNVDHPISIYAATKKSNELIAHSYSHLYRLPTTGLRFFTVYGPWGRPDMAPMIFTKSIISGNPIKVFNNGEMLRDFTYIKDIVNSVSKLINFPATEDGNFNNSNPKPNSSSAPYRIYNLGNSNPISIMKFIEILEKKLNLKANKIMFPMQAGDIKDTFSDISSIEELLGETKKTSLDHGVSKFVEWYKSYFHV